MAAIMSRPKCFNRESEAVNYPYLFILHEYNEWRRWQI